MTCWRCGEEIREWYIIDAHNESVRAPYAWVPKRASLVTALCADCTDEMTELNAP